MFDWSNRDRVQRCASINGHSLGRNSCRSGQDRNLNSCSKNSIKYVFYVEKICFWCLQFLHYISLQALLASHCANISFYGQVADQQIYLRRVTTKIETVSNYLVEWTIKRLVCQRLFDSLMQKCVSIPNAFISHIIID